MSSSSRRVWVSTCRRPTGWAGVPGSVTSTTSAASRVSSSERSSSALRASSAASTPRRAWLAALPTRPRSSGRQLGDAAQQLRQLGLAPEVLDAHALELLRGAGAVDGLRGRLLDLLDAVDHRETSYIATVAAMAALSDSERIGMWQISSHWASTASGSPSRSAPTTSVISPRLELGQRDAPRAAPARRAGPAARRPCARAPAGRRTARPSTPARPCGRRDRPCPGRARRCRPRTRARSAAPCRRCRGR